MVPATQLPDYPSPAVTVTPNHHHNPQSLWSQQLTVHPAVELPDFAKAKQNPKVRSGVPHWGCIRLHRVTSASLYATEGMQYHLSGCQCSAPHSCSLAWRPPIAARGTHILRLIRGTRVPETGGKGCNSTTPKCLRSMPIVIHWLLPRLNVGYGYLHRIELWHYSCCSTKEDILPLLRG